MHRRHPIRDVEEPLRVRFEIRNVFLVTERERFPVLVIDSQHVLPPLDAAIIPRNAVINRNYEDHNPHFMMNYLLERRNFRPHQMDIPFFHRPGLLPMDRMMRQRMVRRRDWEDGFDDRTPRSIPPYVNPNDDYLIDYQDDDAHVRNRVILGAGAGRPPRAIDDNRTRRRERPQTPPRDIPAPQPAPRPTTAASPPTLQAFTIQALINHAVSESMNCPISMNPIDKTTACVTSCQHIFERDSITQWMNSHTTCPVCRQRATLCN
jgi:hypothetical protein